MSLADAIAALALAGCRLVADGAGGLELVVPEGKALPRQVLDTLRAYRQQLLAAHAVPLPPAKADDLGDYLREKGIADSTADLVVHAARLFNVPGQRITIEQVVAEAEPVLFEPGIPMKTTIPMKFHKPGVGYFTLPAGLVGLLIPQIWAIADDHARRGVESTIAEAKRKGQAEHVAVWLAGEPRALAIEEITLEGVVHPAGIDLTPWRGEAAA
jgi:hypothetical protein